MKLVLRYIPLPVALALAVVAETSIFVVAPWDGEPIELGTGTTLAWRPVLD